MQSRVSLFTKAKRHDLFAYVLVVRLMDHLFAFGKPTGKQRQWLGKWTHVDEERET